MEKLCSVSKNKTWSWLTQSIARFRLKLKKVGKTTRSFRYVLNQTPYDYTAVVTNRYKELDLVDSAWSPMDRGPYTVQEAVTKTLQKKKCKKAKWLSEEDFQIAEERREVKG